MSVKGDVEMTRTRTDYTVWTGSALLAIGALFHLTGYAAIPSAKPASEIDKFFDAALHALWLFAGLHWLLIATVCVLAAKSGARFARLILLCCAIFIFTDAVLLFWFLGPFIGAAILAAAATTFLVASLQISSETKLANKNLA